ncbi:MAG TPA: glycosyltransferase [Flavitalea sp.]|nr:glycosyltransferase [Flavitalea sp.]
MELLNTGRRSISTSFTTPATRPLKILIINWSWYPTGGDWTYIENLINFYQQQGHEVIPFSMHSEHNYATPYSRYFISNINYKDLNKNKSLANGVKAVKKTLYSVEAKRNLQKLLEENQIDIAHINNIHHYLTPTSILPLLKKNNIPIIWTVHDYSILCPNTTFTSKDKICEKCKGGAYYQCIVNNCKKNSWRASTIAAVESYTNSLVNPYKYVDFYICPSRFIANKFIEFGFEPAKIRQVYNLFDTDSIPSSVNIPDKKKSIVYVGNITKVKGVHTLVRAVKDRDVHLYVIGSGDHLEELIAYCKSEHYTNITFLGRRNKSDVFKYLKEASFVVVPSEWYENLPYSVVEALLLSKPVLASRIGGIPELIMDGATGFLFEAGNIKDLQNKIDHLIQMDPSILATIGNNAHAHVKKMVCYNSFKVELEKIFSDLSLKL